MPDRTRPEAALPNLTVQQLSYLVAVADSPTFAAAAGSLGVTTSALSQGLAELERRVGLVLFERSGRRRLLRAEAGEVLAHARRVVADTRDLARWAQRVRAGTGGRLGVGMIDAAAVDHFPAELRSFRRESPEVDLRLTVAPSGDLLALLRAGDLDLAVVVEPPSPEPDTVTVGLLEEPLVVVAPERGPVGDPSGWGPWVLFPRGSHTRAVVEEELRRRGAPVEVVAESHQPEVLREMVRLGVGWTVLPEVQAGRRRDGPVLATRRLVLARRSGRVTNPAADALVARLGRRATAARR